MDTILAFPVSTSGVCCISRDELGGFTPDSVRDVFPAEETEILAKLANTLLNSRIVRWCLHLTLFKLGGKHLGREMMLRLRRRRLTKQQWARLQEMDEMQLLAKLPELFASDLNACLTASGTSRVVLLFDSHDAFGC